MRLCRLADIVVAARDQVSQVLAAADPDEDESAAGSLTDLRWGHACLAYDAVRKAVQHLADEEDWLTYQNEQGLAYIFCIGQVPVRLGRPGRDSPVLGREGSKLRQLGEQLRLDYPAEF